MEEFLLWGAFAMSALSLLCSAAALGRRRDGDAPADPEEPAPEEELRRERELNEGVENILSYSVRLGRGRTTGGEPF